MSYSTGQLARLAGVNVETLRYYERRGLLPVPPRTPGGFRQYGRESPSRLRFIRHAQTLGFSLEEIAELLDLRRDRRSNCKAVCARAEHKRAVIDRKLRELEDIRRELDALIASCLVGGDDGCPLLDAMEPDSDAQVRTKIQGGTTQ